MRPLDVPLPRRFSHLQRDGRGYPVISTVSRDSDGADFGSISERRKLALATFDWCAVCGLPFGEEPRWQFLLYMPDDVDPADIAFSEAPVHEICALYSAQVCPHLSSPGSRLGDDERRGQRRPTAVRAIGFSKTMSVEARKSGLQSNSFVFHFAHEEQVDEFSYSTPDDLHDRYHRLLNCEAEVTISSAERTLVDLFNSPGETGGEVTGAALFAGAVYAPNVFRVSTMAWFKEGGTYKTIAAAFLNDARLSQAAADFPDEAGKAVARWLLDKSDTLPSVLAQWREFGRQHVSGRTPAGPKPSGPGRSVPKNASCPCGSGRKARRCHPAGI